MIELTIQTESGSATITLTEIDRLLDVGAEFNITLTEEQVKELLQENDDIALDCLKWGDDTEVGDRFFEAFVEKVTGLSWETLKSRYQDQAYEYVEIKALEKGYST